MIFAVLQHNYLNLIDKNIFSVACRKNMTVARMGQIFTDYESTDFEILLLYGFDGWQVAAVLRAHIQKHHIDGIKNYFFQALL